MPYENDTATRKFHSDPGHGWLEVPLSELIDLEIHKEITGFSYFDPKTKTCFLEEDCDAGTYFESLKSRGVKLIFDEVYSDDDSFVRSLPSYETIRPLFGVVTG